MQVPLQITYRNMPRSLELERHIKRRARELERFYDRIVSCRVLVERSTHHHREGDVFRARVEVGVPGSRVVVGYRPGDASAHLDPVTAVLRAFDAARRRVEDFARRRRGSIKAHAEAPHGRVLRLFPWEGFGFISTPDGREVYFHRNAVVGDRFDELDLGDEVRFDLYEGEGIDGPQASTVRPVGRRHVLRQDLG